MSDLEPNTRAENFWVNEGDLEPITRKEQYIKHLYDETQVVPEYPKTREEYFINKAGEELHDVTVEQLNVTENGTYSEEGKAFSPVIVNVQPDLITKSITQNGTYTASSDNADGYSSVDVHVSGYKITDVSGLPSAIATFSDGANLPMPKLEVAIEPVQDLHGYDAPWVGGSGKNKFPIATATSSGTQNIFTAQTVPLKANTNYVLSFDSVTPTTKDMSLSFNNGNTQVRGITISAEVTSVNLTFSQNIDNIDWYVRETVNLSNIMIEEGSTATTFAPYSNICPIIGWDEVDVTVTDDVDNPTVTHTTTIPFTDGQGQSVEVFGGSVDVVSGGEQSRTLGSVDLGTITWSFVNQRFYAKFNDIKVYSNIDTANLLCDRYKPSKYTSQTDSTISSWNGYVYIRADSFNGDTTAFKTAMNGVQLVYELDTPTTFYTQPTSIKSLDGENNVFADTGDVVEASYWESL